MLLGSPIPAGEVNRPIADIDELTTETTDGIAIKLVVAGAAVEVIVPGTAQ